MGWIQLTNVSQTGRAVRDVFRGGELPYFKYFTTASVLERTWSFA
jgi:hypothetical protein